MTTESNELIGYRYCLIDAQEAGVDDHPQKVIRRIAPDARDMTPESIADAWFFRAPRIEPLPSYITEAPRYFQR